MHGARTLRLPGLPVPVAPALPTSPAALPSGTLLSAAVSATCAIIALRTAADVAIVACSPPAKLAASHNASLVPTSGATSRATATAPEATAFQPAPDAAVATPDATFAATTLAAAANR